MSKCEWEVHAIESGGREESGECRGGGGHVFFAWCVVGVIIFRFFREGFKKFCCCL